MQLLDASEDGIDLEGESPPCWLGVVLLQHIDVLSVEILPFRDGFFYPFCLRDSLPKDFQESGLSTANVAFNGVAVVSLGEFRVESEVVHGLIEVCR